MNKTISINLGGSVFNIEEEAFLILQNYLDKIKINFAGDPASSEIMSDIETRIAEIFQEKNSDKKNVVTRPDIDEMIRVMGRPEDYKIDTEEETNKTNQGFTSGNMRNNKRKIYRDTDDAVIAGVCSGISHYLGWDPIVVRLIFVFLTIVSFGPPGVLGYIIFWALVPDAKTTTEKLHMRGEAVNVENISRFVNEETKAAADRVNKFGRAASQNLRNNSGDFFKGIGRVFAVLFGIVILMIGIGLLGGLVSILIFSEFNFLGFDGNSWDTLNLLIFANDGTIWVLVIGVILAMASPAIALIYASIKIMTGSSKRIKGLAISLLSLFIIGALMCIYGGVKTAKLFSRDAEITSSTLIAETASDTIQFEVMADSIFVGRKSHHGDFNDLVKIGSEKNYYGEPLRVRFEPTNANQCKVVVNKSSQGSSMEQAGILARAINFEYWASGDSIKVSPYFSTPHLDPYRAQEVEMLIFVPIGKHVRFGKQSEILTWYSEEDGVLLMTEDGLEDENNKDKNQHKHNGHPKVTVTDDSVIIKTDELEIKTSRE